MFNALSTQTEALPLAFRAEVELKKNQNDGVTMGAEVGVFVSPTASQEGDFDSNTQEYTNNQTLSHCSLD